MAFKVFLCVSFLRSRSWDTDSVRVIHLAGEGHMGSEACGVLTMQTATCAGTWSVGGLCAGQTVERMRSHHNHFPGPRGAFASPCSARACVVGLGGHREPSGEGMQFRVEWK